MNIPWRKRRTDDGEIKEETQWLKEYFAFCYRLLGSTYDKKANPDLDEKLKRANLPITSGIYMATMMATGIIFGTVAALFSIIVLLLVLNLSIWIFLTVILFAVAFSAGISFLPIVVNMRISNRRVAIDREIAFSLSELSILASTGLSPIDVIRKIAKRCDDEAMAAEFKKIVYKIDIEGKDIISALGETARESPSQRFRETLWDLANMIHQGGNLDEYLRKKADDVMTLKRTIQKEFVERLMGLSEIFVSLVLVGVLFIGIAAFLLQATATDAGGIDGNALLIILAVFIIPFAAFMFVMVISSAYSKTE
jgi:archaeal flagellar protein FlaJ